MNAILNVREPYSIMKLVRNKKRLYLGIDLPLAIALDYTTTQDLGKMIPLMGMQFGLIILPELLAAKVTGVDIFKEKSTRNLQKLLPQLNNLNISTNLEKILKAEEYDRTYKLVKKETGIPHLEEHKYIMLPCYDVYSGNNNDEKEVSIHQEHIKGSKEYVLSLGSPTKSYKVPQGRTQFI